MILFIFFFSRKFSFPDYSSLRPEPNTIFHWRRHKVRRHYCSWFGLSGCSGWGWKWTGWTFRWKSPGWRSASRPKRRSPLECLWTRWCAIGRRTLWKVCSVSKKLVGWWGELGGKGYLQLIFVAFFASSKLLF